MARQSYRVQPFRIAGQRTAPERAALARVLHFGAHEAASAVLQRGLSDRDALVNALRTADEVRAIIAAAPGIDVKHLRAVLHDPDTSTPD
jgi:hypothetical protein